MKKLSESVWGDIRKKSLGKEERTEDDVNLLSKDEFYDYINDHYEVRDNKPGEPRFGMIRQAETFGIVTIPLIVCGFSVYNLCIQYTTAQNVMYRLYISMGKETTSLCEDFIDELNNNFDVNINSAQKQIKFNDFSNEIIIKIIELVLSKYQEISILVKK